MKKKFRETQFLNSNSFFFYLVLNLSIENFIFKKIIKKFFIDFFLKYIFINETSFCQKKVEKKIEKKI